MTGYPAFDLQIAYGIPSTTVPSGGDWVSEAAYLEEVHVETGRDDEWSGFDAGKLTAVLANRTGRFDPDFAAGPHYGDLLPFTPARLLGGASSATEDVFYGFVNIDGFKVTPLLPADSRCDLTLVDAFELLRNAELPESAYEVDIMPTEPTALWWLDDPEGSTVARAAIGEDASYEFPAVQGDPLVRNSSRASMRAASDSNVTSSGKVILPTSSVPTYPDYWTIAWWMTWDAAANGNRFLNMLGGTGEVWVGAGMSGTIEVTIRDDAATVEGLSATVPTDGAPHLYAIVLTSGTLELYIDGVLADSSGALSDVTLLRGPWEFGFAGLGGTTTQDFAALAVWDGAGLDGDDLTELYNAGAGAWAGDTTGQRVNRILDAINWPDSLRRIELGLSTMTAVTLGTDALSLIQEAAEAEGGRLFIDHRDAGKVRFLARDSLLLVGVDLLTPNQRSLETDTTGWAASGGNTTIARSTAQAHVGSASLLFNRISGQGTVEAHTPTGTAGFPLDPGRVYSLVLWAYADDVIRPVTVYLYQYNAAGIPLNASVLADDDEVFQTWTQYEGSVSASTPFGLHPDSRFGALYIDIGGVATSEDHFVDDIHLYVDSAVALVAEFGDADDGSEVPCTVTFADDRIINRVVASRDGGLEATVEDLTATVQHPRSLTLTGLKVEDDADVVSRAEWIVNTKKTRKRRVVSVTLDPAASSHLAWGEVFERAITDRVTVTNRPVYGGGPITYECVIEGIKHDFDRKSGQPLQTTLMLSPAPPIAGTWDSEDSMWDEAVWV